MNYLVVTLSGNLYYHNKDNKLKLLEYRAETLLKSYDGFRFIKYLEGTKYILGTAEELLIFDIYGFSNPPQITGKVRLPGVFDIKDICIHENFIAMLDGARDSVYIFDKDFKNIHTCFNIGAKGNVEFFTERQTEYHDLDNPYFQLFYGPALNNYHKFNRFILKDNILELINDTNFKSVLVNLNNFTCINSVPTTYQVRSHDFFHETKIDMGNETVTDYIKLI